MKSGLSVIGALLLAVLTAIISPIVVAKYQAREAATAQVINFYPDSRMALTPELLRAGVKTSGTSGIKVAHQAFFKNAGSEDIYNVKLELVGKDGSEIFDVGGVMGLGSAKTPSFRVANGRANAEVEFLKKGEVVGLWVTTNAEAVIEPRSLTKGLKVVTQSPLDSSEDIWLIVGLTAATFLIGLIVGGFVSEAAYNAVLRGIGFDPKEIQESYVEQRAKNKKAN